MSKITIKINAEAILPPLLDSEFQEKKLKLLESMDQSIYARYAELIYCLNQNPVNKLAYPNIRDKFEIHFTNDTFEKAILMTLLLEEQYNLKQNMLSLLTEEKLDAAIMGKAMINAFIDAISEMPSDDDSSSALKAALIFDLKTYFEEETPLESNAEVTVISNYDPDIDKKLANFAKWLKDNIDE